MVTIMPEPRFLHLSCRLDQGVLIAVINRAELRGEELTDAVRKELIAAVEHFGSTRVVLDLKPVEFLTSLGIRALMNFRRHLREKGGQVLLCNLEPAVAEILMVTRLAGVSQSSLIPFGIAPDAATAVTALAGVTSDK
jgi:anti-anti-sigma factor